MGLNQYLGVTQNVSVSDYVAVGIAGAAGGFIGGQVANAAASNVIEEQATGVAAGIVAGDIAMAAGYGGEPGCQCNN